MIDEKVEQLETKLELSIYIKKENILEDMKK